MPVANLVLAVFVTLLLAFGGAFFPVEHPASFLSFSAEAAGPRAPHEMTITCSGTPLPNDFRQSVHLELNAADLREAVRQLLDKTPRSSVSHAYRCEGTACFGSFAWAENQVSCQAQVRPL